MAGSGQTASRPDVGRPAAGRDVEFGVLVPLGWRGELVGLAPDTPWERLRHLAILAEDLGLDSVWVSDHVMAVPGVPAGADVFECWSVTSALAAATTRVRLGQLASCAVLRPPALTAKITACIDVMSGGRLEWGVGAGWHAAEAIAYGYAFPGPGERIAALAEHVEIVRRLWTEPTVTADGVYHQVHGAQCDPKPLQRPHPPVLVAGSGPRRTLRVVAHAADRANWGGDPEAFAATAAVLHAHCDDIGRDPTAIDLTWGGELFIRDRPAELRAEWQGAALQHDPFDAWSERSLVGNPEQVAATMVALIDAGCQAFIPWCHDFPSETTLRRYAEEVVPLVRSALRSDVTRGRRRARP
jgi:alkanesulfonate monooxygenase SsuD/methylene tetrahydromethanopterin reductase-like flavin-dependent oxidoreductase (luciferase family)